MGLSTGREKLGNMANTSRMTSYQRREQLIEIGRSLFAAKGFEAVSVEEIASTAKVSKPIVYEHFGGKEGLYAVVVDREMRALTDVLINALSDPQAHPRQIVERTALALLDLYGVTLREPYLARAERLLRLRCSPTWRRTPKASACSRAIRRKPTRPTRSIRCLETLPYASRTFSPTRSNASICRPKACRITRRCSSA